MFLEFALDNVLAALALGIGHDQAGHQVDQAKREEPGHDQENQGDQPHDGGINVEVVGETATDPEEDLVL